MRIALLTSGIYPYKVGGMERHSYYLAKYLARNQVKVDIYHPWITEEEPLHIFTEAERQYLRFYGGRYPAYVWFPGHYLLESYRYSQRLYKIFQMQPEVDFIYTKGLAGWAFLKRKKKGADLPPLGVNLHGYEMFQPPPSFKVGLQHLMLRSPAKYQTRHADYVFSYGGKITEIIRGLGVSQKNIIEIPTGITRDWLVKTPKATEKPRKFVFVGRYERRKGIEELNQALAHLLKEYEFECQLVGPIPPRKQLDHPSVKYWGKITDAEKLKEIIQNNDVLVCPSHSEGMPNVLLEGMASGLAVIASDVGAVSVVVSEENGWLIEPGSREDLTNAMREVIELQPAKLGQKKKNALRGVEHRLLWDKVGQQTVQAIETIIN